LETRVANPGWQLVSNYSSHSGQPATMEFNELLKSLLKRTGRSRRTSMQRTKQRAARLKMAMVRSWRYTRSQAVARI